MDANLISDGFPAGQVSGVREVIAWLRRATILLATERSGLKESLDRHELLSITQWVSHWFDQVVRRGLTVPGVESSPSGLMTPQGEDVMSEAYQSLSRQNGTASTM